MKPKTPCPPDPPGIETHPVNVIELKLADRAALLALAKRYRVRNPTRFLEGCLAAEDRKGNGEVLFRCYEK